MSHIVNGNSASLSIAFDGEGPRVVEKNEATSQKKRQLRYGLEREKEVSGNGSKRKHP